MKKQDQMAILLEDMQSKFDLILEGHAALNHKIESTAQETHNRIDVLDEKICILNRKIDTVKAELSTRIDQVETKLSHRIDQVETKLSTRIDQVETSLCAKIDAVAVDLTAHRTDTETHRTPYRVSESSS